jgi:hypothetical protein
MNKEKVIYYQQQTSLSGATDFQSITTIDSKHRSELLASEVELT